MSAPDYVRILAAYAPGQTRPTQTHFKDMAGAPRATRGNVACTEHFGGTPGTFTYTALRDDEIAIAVSFNKDAPSSFSWKGATRESADVWHEVLSGVTQWPTADQFPAVMTAPVQPGPERLDIFATGLDGAVSQAAGGECCVRAGVAGDIDDIVAKVPVLRRGDARLNHLDLFMAGTDGRPPAGWAAAISNRHGGLVEHSHESFQPGGNLAVSAPNKLDVFPWRRRRLRCRLGSA
jgi:hypothetical protein